MAEKRRNGDISFPKKYYYLQTITAKIDCYATANNNINQSKIDGIAARASIICHYRQIVTTSELSAL